MVAMTLFRVPRAKFLPPVKAKSFVYMLRTIHAHHTGILDLAMCAVCFKWRLERNLRGGGGMTLRARRTGPHVPKRPQLWFPSIFLYEICYTSSWDNTEQIKITLKENNQKRVERLNNKGRSNAPWNRTKRYAILSEFGSSESSL